MKIWTLALCVVTSLLVPSVHANAQSGDWRDRLRAQLEATYQPTETSTFDANSIAKAGDVLIVKQDGIAADRAKSSIGQVTIVDNGRVSVSGGGFFSKKSSTTLDPGEKVYVTDIAVKDDSIDMQLLTATRRDIVEKGSTEHARFRATLKFKFSKGSLATATVADVRSIIDSVIALDR